MFSTLITLPWGCLEQIGHHLEPHAEIDAARASLIDRAAALRSYADQLDSLLPLLAAVNSLTRLERVNDRIDQLVGQTVSDEFATESNTALRTKLIKITSALQVVMCCLIGRPLFLP